MKDRVPRYPGRVKLTPVSGQTNTYDMVRADQPTQEGTPLNKDTLLKDTTATALGLTGDPTVDEAFAKLAKKSEYKVGDIKVTARTDLGDEWVLCDGSPLPGNSEIGDAIPNAEYPENWAKTMREDSAADIFATADGTVYILGNISSGHQYLYRYSKQGSQTGVFDVSSIYKASTPKSAWSVCVARGNMYLYAMGDSSSENRYSVFWAPYSGGDFPTTWTEVEIPLATLSGSTGYHSGNRYKIRVTSSLFWFAQSGYYSSWDSSAIIISYASTLGEAPTTATSLNYTEILLAIDSCENVICAQSGYANLWIFNGNTGVQVKSTSMTYAATGFNIVEDSDYTYVLAINASQGLLLYGKIYKSNPADSRTQISNTSASHLDKYIFKYNDAFYSIDGSKIYKIPNFGTSWGTEDTGKTVPTSSFNRFNDGFAFGNTAFGYVSKAWYNLVPAMLPAITFDGAYAYIKVKEVTT